MIQFFLILFLSISAAFAQDFNLRTKFLTGSQIAKIIGAYPKIHSVESKADFDILFSYQKNRTEADCELAKKDEELKLATLFGGEAGILNSDEVKRLTPFMLKAFATVGSNSHLSKIYFKRPRPYLTEPTLKPCISLESSDAYPSGHSLFAQLYARIISKVYPERAELLLNRAQEYSLNRVIGGVHHPSDVKAAHVLADYLAIEMIKDKNFLKELNSL